ncbi:Uncharacterized ferredoxin-like protein YfaE [Candidatus Erwinia haradaeae]|uniref:Uncharacterized ferredoxin-like protein YfaE n=2 Tax=Candidatus Erwinia haradaeae TaxID=1922217 RepID=A0A451CYP2_9GAMM|nr:Uncharacterized ferredoxin-like protein YfaE [Candidatus Erwinia haradaeae]
MTPCMIIIRPSGTEIQYYNLYDTLLSIIESYHIYIEYQCRAGYCGCCRTRLLKGTVTYNILPLTCIKPGEILPCLCYVHSDIEIELYGSM